MQKPDRSFPALFFRGSILLPLLFAHTAYEDINADLSEAPVPLIVDETQIKIGLQVHI